MSASARGAGLAVGVVTLVVAVLVGTGTGSETTVFRARTAPAASADDHLETTAALQTAIVRAELLPPPEELAAAERQGPPGEAGQRHGPPAGFLGNFLVTCYALGGHTATGAPVSTAVVAVDPRVVRLGSRVMIGGVGRRVAADTGGAIRGHRLDIWMPSVSACRRFGVRRLPVYQA